MAQSTEINRESSLEVTKQVLWKTKFKEEAQREDAGSVYIKQRLTSNLEWCAQAQASPILCNPMHRSPPGSSAHGIFQARILEWVAISYSRGSSRPRDRTCISCTASGFFTPLPLEDQEARSIETEWELLRQPLIPIRGHMKQQKKSRGEENVWFQTLNGTQLLDSLDKLIWGALAHPSVSVQQTSENTVLSLWQ